MRAVREIQPGGIHPALNQLIQHRQRSLAGPMVQTILAFRILVFLIS